MVVYDASKATNLNHPVMGSVRFVMEVPQIILTFSITYIELKFMVTSGSPMTLFKKKIRWFVDVGSACLEVEL
jgi:hypothetical protein